MNADRGVEDLAGADLFHVSLGADLVLDLAIAGKQPAGDMAAQVQPADQVVARFVQHGAKPKAAVIGMHADIRAIEPFAIGVVPGQPVIAAGLQIGVLKVVEIEIGAEIRRTPGNPAVFGIDHGKLALGENLHMLAVHLGGDDFLVRDGGEAGALDVLELLRDVGR